MGLVRVPFLVLNTIPTHESPKMVSLPEFSGMLMWVSPLNSPELWKVASIISTKSLGSVLLELHSIATFPSLLNCLNPASSSPEV